MRVESKDPFFVFEEKTTVNAMPETDLCQRIEKLESAVRELQQQADASNATENREQAPRKTRSAVPTSDIGISTRPQRSERTASSRNSTTHPAEHLKSLLERNSEALLNRIGIGLLLLGVAFLFKFSVDAGWITETVRVAFGVGLGAYLLITAVRIAPRRARLAAILNGGGIAIFYGTAFAAFALYGLIDATAAFGYLVGVTALAFLISLYQQDAPLSAVAALGGLAAPLLVPADDPSVIGLAVYVSLIVVGTTATYMYRGWRLPLFTAAAGAWIVLLLGYLAASDVGPITQLERLALQGGVIFYGLAFGCGPVVRELLRERALRSYPPGRPIDTSDTGVMRDLELLLTVTTPFAVLCLSEIIWPSTPAIWGWISMIAAVGYAGAAAVFDGRSRSLPKAHGNAMSHLATSHRFVSAAMLTVSIVVLCEAPWLMPALALEAILVNIAARRRRDDVLKFVAFVLFAAATLLFVDQVTSRSAELNPLFNAPAAAGLAALALTAAYALALQSGAGKLVMAVVTHALFLAWILAELGAAPGGQAYVTVAWGLYATSLFVVGASRQADQLRLAGLLTLLVTIGKLLVFDLAALDAVWRILLFLGFGATLLLLSYYAPDLWKAPRLQREQAAEA